jgi:outer membrane protein assembly factor BamD
MLQQCPQTRLRPEAELRLREVQDNLAMHNLGIARFYYDTRYRHNRLGLKGSQDRLKEIVEKWPNFCLMDEVLFRWANTYQEEEEPDEAAKLYQRLVRDYPNSEFVEKAKEQLNIIGATIPDPDPIKKNLPACEKPTFMQNMMQQISGSANVTTSRDGILITRKGEGNDLIDKAIANNGQLPEGVQPVTQRTLPRAPAVQPPPTPSPETSPGTSPATRPRSTQSPTPKP